MFQDVAYETYPPGRGNPPTGEPPAVFLYALTFCPHCDLGKEFLTERGCGFRMVYVDKIEPEIRRTVLRSLRETYGKSVLYPVLEIHGEFTFGFSPEVWRTRLEEPRI